MKTYRSTLLAITSAILISLWSLTAAATPGNPAPYFTNNLTATSAGTTITEMEQASLARRIGRLPMSIISRGARRYGHPPCA